MTTVNTDTLSSLGLAGNHGAAGNATGTGTLGQANFLQLMTEQLKNQDPLKPLDSQQFLGQLAQFSTVQGIDQMQTAMGAMATVMESDQTLRAAALVGHDALVEASSMTLAPGATVDGEVEAARAGPVTVEISDAKGNVVRRMTLTAEAAGATTFHWDGLTDAGTPATGGTYAIKAASGNAPPGSATDRESLAVGVLAKVESVSIGAAGLSLNLAGMGSYALSAVRRIG